MNVLLNDFCFLSLKVVIPQKIYINFDQNGTDSCYFQSYSQKPWFIFFVMNKIEKKE